MYCTDVAVNQATPGSSLVIGVLTLALLQSPFAKAPRCLLDVSAPSQADTRSPCKKWESDWPAATSQAAQEYLSCIGACSAQVPPGLAGGPC